MSSTDNYEERILAILRELKIPATYSSDTGLPLYREAAELESVDLDVFGREQKLTPEVSGRWKKMQSAAEQDGVCLLLVSAFRSVTYQRQIWERKLAEGKTVQEIIAVSAAPGFSEHHTGRAVDLTSDNCRPVSEDFEHTPAFAWLLVHATEFGFTMTYPRLNRFGIIYEPWHWSVKD